MLRQIWVRLGGLIRSEGAGGGAQEETDAHIWWWYHCALSNITLSWRYLKIWWWYHTAIHPHSALKISFVIFVERVVHSLLRAVTSQLSKSWKGRKAAAWGCYDIHASYILRRFLPQLMHLWMPGRDWRQISMKCKLRCTKWLSTSQVKGSGQGICNYVLFLALLTWIIIIRFMKCNVCYFKFLSSSQVKGCGHISAIILFQHFSFGSAEFLDEIVQSREVTSGHPSAVMSCFYICLV